MRPRVYDYIVLGAGPAGLQMGYHMQRAGWDYLILEAGEVPGEFFRRFPRHRKLISINKRHTGYDHPELRLRMDWNSLLSDDPRLLFPNFSASFFPRADDLLRYLAEFATTFSLNVQYGTRIQRISRPDQFELTTESGQTYYCRRLIVATGVSLPHVPDIPGIRLADTYLNASVDPRDYLDQRVLVIGKGNSAFETADALVETTSTIHVVGPHAIKFAWRTHFVGHLRAVNNNILDTYQLKSQNAILDAQVLRIRKHGRQLGVLMSFVRANEVHKELFYDRVILCTGFRFDRSLFADDCRPELVINDRFPAQTSSWESVNVPDLFFAGTLMQQRDYKRSTSGFIHGFRYCVGSLHRMLASRYHGAPWPARLVRTDAASLADVVIRRVNTTSALWQLFGFLGDVLICDGPESRYLEELPVDFIHGSSMARDRHYFVITLEYGPDHDRVDPFDINVGRVAQDDAEDAINAQYLHPVIRHYCDGKLLDEHHVAENLENQWDGPAHVEPLQLFFVKRLAKSKVRDLDDTLNSNTLVR